MSNPIKVRAMKERLKAAFKEMQEIAEELQSMENEYAAKKGDWYDRNLMLNYSGLMNDAEFGTKVWNVNHEQLREDFGSSISTLLWAMRGFLEHYEKFEEVRKRLDDLLANEENRVSDGWKSYKVKYNEKGCSTEQEFYCYAPDSETAFEFCRKVNGSDVLSINEAEEVKL